MKNALCAALAALSVPAASTVAAPVASAKCGDNEIRLYAAPLAFEVVSGGETLVPKTEIGLTIDGEARGGESAPVAGPVSEEVRGAVETPVYKKESVDLSSMQTFVDFGDWGVRLAARKDGVAYRFELKKSATVDFENAGLTLPKGARCWFNRTRRSSLGCEETVPEFADASSLATDEKKAFYLPFVYAARGKTVAVVESDVRDYPVLNYGDVVQTADGARLEPLFAKYPKSTYRVGGWGKEKNLPSGGRWIKVSETEDFIAKASGPRALPWRAFILADAPAKLCEADIVYALAAPAAKGADFSWVKPGKVAWDWWNAFDNGKGCNTKTYVRFIDFAAANGVEYVIFDEGWSAKLDIWNYSPAVDVPYLIDYANKKGVGIILWMAWAQVYGEEEKVASHFAKLGAKGFKVDFMDRGDAGIAAFLEKFAAACAKNKMLLDYHGAYRPTGLQRKYPNILNYEGIHGLEQMKWGKKEKDMCANDVAAFFLRMTAGPMDYTPGAMDNYPVGDYRGNGKNPGSVGTRCRQMALMALYEAPLQMLSDSPTKYEKNMECFSFMAATPVVWKETVGLGGDPETFAAAARRAGDGSWYAAGMTNREGRDFTLDTSFLGGGEWTAEIFRDASDDPADTQKYVHEKKSVKGGDKIPFRMAPGGGFVVKFAKSGSRRGADAAFSAAAEIEFVECPKCDRRIRVSPDAKKAYVNLSRLDGATKEARAARAQKLLDAAKIPAPTDVKRPLAGWSSWNTFGCEISEEVILETARAMATNGLKAAGYMYVNIDDGFMGGHGEDGILRFNPRRFPNGMKPTVDGIHAAGLKAGIYSDAGADTCGSLFRDAKGNYDLGGKGGGLYGHDAADCKLHFLDLGFDFIKVDYCGARRLRLDERKRYTEISKAIKATGRTDVRLNLCRWAFPGTWAADIAESWRMSGDIRANWRSLKGIVKENLYLSAYARPGAYNDMDMLETGHIKGHVKTVFGKSDEGFTADEEELHFGTWCIMSSPLLIGCDVRYLPAQTMALVTNPYLLAMNQNDLGLQAYVAQRVGRDGYVLVKDADELFGTARYVALLNLSDSELEFTVEAKTLDLGGTVEVFDLADRSDPGSFKDRFTLRIRPHAAKFYRFDAEKRLERAVYEAETAFLTEYQEIRDPKQSGTAFTAEVAGASGGVAVRYIGNRETNDLVWKNVKIDRGGKRTLVFRCSAPEAWRFFVQIDGGEKIKVDAAAADGKFIDVPLEVELAEGIHAIRVSNGSAWAPDIDMMTLK